MSTLTTTFEAGSPQTLANLIEADTVPFATLDQHYHPLLEMVRVLIGVVPECDRYLEVWPPAFKSYNLIVPNLLNLPFSLLNRQEKTLKRVALGMYYSSQAAQCPYCTAHTCSFALRRGVKPSALLLDEHHTPLTEAIASVARGLADVPSSLTAIDAHTLVDHLGFKGAEKVVLGIAMMGFLNKYMDGMGINLEPETAEETAAIVYQTAQANEAPTPPEDTWRQKLKVAQVTPGAIALDIKAQSKTPLRRRAIRGYLRLNTGSEFSILEPLHNARAFRAIASTLVENLNPAEETLPIATKLEAGLLFCRTAHNNHLASHLHEVARHFQVTLPNPSHLHQTLQQRAPDECVLLTLAAQLATTPAQVKLTTLKEANDLNLPSKHIVELVAWFGVLQLLNRLHNYYTALGRLSVQKKTGKNNKN